MYASTSPEEQLCRDMANSGSPRGGIRGDEVTGQIIDNFSEPIECRIAARYTGGGCYICNAPLDDQHRLGLVVWDPDNYLPYAYYDGSGDRKICADCVDWIDALHHYKRQPKTTFSFEEGERVWSANARWQFEVVSRNLTGVEYCGAIWPLYRCWDVHGGDADRLYLVNECNLGARVEALYQPRLERSLVPEIMPANGNGRPGPLVGGRSGGPPSLEDIYGRGGRAVIGNGNGDQNGDPPRLEDLYPSRRELPWKGIK